MSCWIAATTTSIILFSACCATGCRQQESVPLLSEGTPTDPVFTPERIRDTSYVEGRIASGLDPNLFNGSPTNQDSLLTYAVRHNAEATIAKLIDRGANVDIRSKGMNKTPLFQAAFDGRLSIVKLLIERGADVQAVDLMENNVLREAIAAGNAEVVKCLLDTGVDPLHRNSDGKTMLDLAEKHGNDKVKAELREAARKKPASNVSN